MNYRIQILRDERVLADIASDERLPDTREKALDLLDLLDGHFALIVDATGQQIDLLKRSL